MASTSVKLKKTAAERPARTEAVEQRRDPLVSGAPGLALTDVGVRYRLLTEDQRTLKGRLLGLAGGRNEQAEFWALRNFSLSVKQGDVVGVLGSNGSGKSTLMRVMSKVIRPTEGTVAVDGEISPMLELGGAFNPELTGRENAYLHGALHRIPRAEMDEIMPRIQAFADIGPFFDVPVKTYSTGMVSRLAFAVAVQSRPDILLVDEVFSVGDESFQRKSAIRMKRLIEQGVIVVLVSHSMGVIRQVCNRAIWLNRGTLMEDGSPMAVTEAYLRHSSEY